MMKINRKWVAGIAVALSVGAAFWARELASWRPVMVAKLFFQPEEMQVSRDEKFLLVEGPKEGIIGVDPGDGVEGGRKTIIDLETGDEDEDPKLIDRFNVEHGVKPFPNIRFDRIKKQLVFSPMSERKLVLQSVVTDKSMLKALENDYFALAWSKTAGEIYGFWNGEIFIWNWTTGKLKKRMCYANRNGNGGVFSPDGKKLLIIDHEIPDGGGNLAIYEVQRGKKLLSTVYIDGLRDFGFSPDGKFLWATDADWGGVTRRHIQVFSMNQSKVLWTANRSGPVKWLADGRIGIVTAQGLEWRDASGRLIRRLPGPYGSDSNKGAFTFVEDWALSPDGNWIYSCENDGTVRRWRAR